MTNIVSIDEYEDAVSNDMGFCTNCQEFTRECTEPDAEHYDCPQCEKNTVMGAEQALLACAIEVSEED